MGQSGQAPTRRSTAVILAAAAVLLVAGGIGVYGHATVLDERAFADRAVGTLRQDEVDEDLASRVAERVVVQRPALTPVEDLLRDAMVLDVIPAPAYQATFRAATVRMHRQLFEGAGGPVSLRVPGTIAALRASLESRAPAAAGGLRTVGDPALLTIGYNARERLLLDLARPARRAAGLAPLAVVLGLALLVLAVVRDRRRGPWAVGLAVAAAGGVCAAAVTAAGELLLEGYDTSAGDTVVGTVWDAYLGDLRSWALAVAAAGLVVAAAAGGPRLDPRALVAAPRGSGARLLRAAGLLSAAALAIAVPDVLLHLALVALAGALTYVAAGELIRSGSSGAGSSPS